MTTSESTLNVRTFDELFREKTLPSGHSFELAADDVDTALTVAEQDHSLIYMRKALQAHCVVKSIGGRNIHGENGLGVEFINGLLDTDVIFIGLAWTAQMENMNIELDSGVPCPYCSHPWMKIPFGNLKIWCRNQPVSGMENSVSMAVDKGLVPKSMGTELVIVEPTWESSRRHVPEKRWESQEHIMINRAMSAVRVRSSDGSSLRQPSYKGELRKMRMQAINQVSKVLDSTVPFIERQLDLHCENCGKVSHIPFDQGA